MLKTLTGQIKQYKKASILTILFAMLEVIMEISIPLLMASIIDDGISKGNISHVYLYGAIMLSAASISLLCGFLAGKFAARASTGFSCNLRDAMYSNIQTFSFTNIDKYSTPGLVTRLTTDVTNLQEAYQMMIRMCIRAPFTLILAMIMAMTISMRISTIFFIAIIFLTLCLGFIISKALPTFNYVFKKYDNLNASVQENISGIRVVKSFVREEHENDKFYKAADNVYKLFVKAEKYLAFNNPAMMIAMYGCILSISWFGANFVVNGSLTTGQLTSLFSYVMNILMSLMMFSMVFVMITISIASARRISEVINEKADIVSPTDALKVVADGSIRFDHVSFSYKEGSKNYVLSDIDLHIHSGETIGIIGQTGSAKSTLVSLISHLYDVSKGSVMVGGKDVRSYDLDTLRNQVAVVLQKNELFSGTILENLRWGNENASEEECRYACQLACADEFIQRFPKKYETYIEQGGSNVSGGQKQRLCIARALLKKPKVLILDDSTSAVDTATDVKIRKAFKEDIPGTTKLIVAQRISSIQDADRIIILENGKVQSIGTHEELLANNKVYQDVYNEQTKGGGDFDELKDE